MRKKEGDTMGGGSGDEDDENDDGGSPVIVDVDVETHAMEEDWSGTGMGSCLTAATVEIEVPLRLPTRSAPTTTEHTRRPTRTLRLQCLAENDSTPLDVTDVRTSTSGDSTGLSVWPASWFLLDAVNADLALPPPRHRDDDDDDNDDGHGHGLNHSPKRQRCKCLELGCGTGIVGLSLWLTGRVTEMVLTDGDPEVVEVCRENLRRNRHLTTTTTTTTTTSNATTTATSSVRVARLAFGEDPPAAGSGDGDHPDRENTPFLSDCDFDVAVACDVVYEPDVTLGPLMETLRRSNASTVCLAHTPRFADRDELEQRIHDAAAAVGLELRHTVRPRDVYSSSSSPSSPPPFGKEEGEDSHDHKNSRRAAMEEAEAVLYIFER